MNGQFVPFLDVAAANAEVGTEVGDALKRVLESGWYVLGPEVTAFESEFAELCQADDCVGVGTGLDAVEIGLRALGVGPGDEVIVPSHTFIATWLAVFGAGATPVPVEPESAWSGLNPDAVSSAITSRTTAVISVDMYGHPSDTHTLLDVTRQHGLALLGDAAQAHGASRHQQMVGSMCDATAFSFYPAKNLGALGDGGALVTNDREVASRARQLRNYGGVEKYEHSVVGTNSRLDEIQAAVLRAKLVKLHAWNRRRSNIAERYLEGLSPLADRGSVVLPEVAMGTNPSWHVFSLLTERREQVRSLLKADGIQTGVHYPVPPHLTGAFQYLGYGQGAFPLAERISAMTLSLPMGPHLSAEDVDYVLCRVHSVLATR